MRDERPRAADVNGRADAPARQRLLPGAARMLAAVNLRPTVASVGPVLDDVRASVGLSAAGASALTALPVLCFGVGALLAPRLSRRFGSETVLAAVMALTAAGLLLRIVPPCPCCSRGRWRQAGPSPWRTSSSRLW
jgi:CP family cyanate transporter-like MFS transporter